MRNDFLTRQFSLNKKKISYKEHAKWFLKNWNKFFYLFLINEDIAGYVRFEKKNFFKLNYTLNKKYRGKKYSIDMLQLSIQKLKKKYKNYFIKATVKKNNLKSINILKLVNFKVYYVTKKNFYLKYKI